MESWNISKKLKSELLSKARGIEDNSRRILYILSMLGPQRFTNLIIDSNLSRSTVSKYLNLHQENNYIEQKIITDPITNKQYSGYVITDKGKEKLGEKSDVGSTSAPTPPRLCNPYCFESHPSVCSTVVGASAAAPRWRPE